MDVGCDVAVHHVYICLYLYKSLLPFQNTDNCNPMPFETWWGECSYMFAKRYGAYSERTWYCRFDPSDQTPAVTFYDASTPDRTSAEYVLSDFDPLGGSFKLTISTGGGERVVALNIQLMKLFWVNATEVGELDTSIWYFNHRCVVSSVSYPNSTTLTRPNNVTLRGITETETSRYSWFLEDSPNNSKQAFVKVSEDLPPTNVPWDHHIFMNFANSTLSANAPKIQIQDMPFSNDLSVLDGCWIKLGRSAGGDPVSNSPYNGAMLYPVRVKVSGVNLNIKALGDFQQQTSVYERFSLFQLRRIPSTDHFELFHSSEYGRLGTANYDTDPFLTKVVFELLNSSSVVAENFEWKLDFSPGGRDIYLYNTTKHEYLTFDSGEIGITSSLGRACPLTLEIIQSTVSYEKVRYNRSDDLKALCCSETASKVLPEPKGYGNNVLIDYSRFCPPEYLRDPLTTSTQSTLLCDSLMEIWCRLEDNKSIDLCSCFSALDAPALPDDPLIHGVRFCFSTTCRESGYALRSQLTNLGTLDCDLQTICSNLLVIENRDYTDYPDARAYIDCDENGHQPCQPYRGDGEVNLVLVGVWVAVAIVSLLLLGLSIAYGRKAAREISSNKMPAARATQ